MVCVAQKEIEMTPVTEFPFSASHAAHLPTSAEGRPWEEADVYIEKFDQGVQSQSHDGHQSDLRGRGFCRAEGRNSFSPGSGTARGRSLSKAGAQRGLQGERRGRRPADLKACRDWLVVFFPCSSHILVVLVAWGEMARLYFYSLGVMSISAGGCMAGRTTGGGRVELTPRVVG